MSKTSDYEAESNSGLEKEEGAEEEEEEVDYEKLDNLEKGDSVGFRLRIPGNLNEMILDYN